MTSTGRLCILDSRQGFLSSLKFSSSWPGTYGKSGTRWCLIVFRLLSADGSGISRMKLLFKLTA
jgi:hypothetical protein